MASKLLVRYGEISLKGHNRAEFERALLANIRRALAGWPGVAVQRIGGRLVVHVEDEQVEAVAFAVARVFGVLSVSPATAVAADLTAMTEATVGMYRRAVAELVRTRPSGQQMAQQPAQPTFKCSVRRADKRFPMTSMQLAATLGEQVLRQEPEAIVDVHRPDITLSVEIRPEGVYLFGHTLHGVGGMPIGTGERAGLLLSGGIDSPVAGWLAMKRGVELEAIHFESSPFTSQQALEKVENLCQILANWGGRLQLHSVHFTGVQTAIRKHCPEPLHIIIMRRMMMRIADQIAVRRRLLGLVTGESLGQVASQTLASLRTIGEVTSLPMLRPLISEDKVDIIRRAREIGTYDVSILPYEDCCTLFVPKNPRTRPRPEEAQRAEARLDVETLVSTAVDGIRTQVFSAGGSAELA